ncbi:MAG TPA: CmcI family methyltransferase [Fimbriimonadaceae bacterium]|nr:CmcI family methyltransferase [Fimbriimonadaceae bacterium]
MVHRIRLKLNAAIWRILTPVTVNLFHKLVYFHKRDQTWMNTRWLGAKVQKIPFDLWVEQEIIFETKPDLIIETGTYDGGSTLFYAHLFDIMGNGEVVSIDIAAQQGLPQHPRITYISASSVDADVVSELRKRAADKRVMVILDSDHSRDHVMKELEVLAPLTSPGCYLIVEDTNVNGHPVLWEHGPGPMEAVRAWEKNAPPFERDPSREKFMVTFNPRGYWKRR